MSPNQAELARDEVDSRAEPQIAMKTKTVPGKLVRVIRKLK